MGMEDGAAEGPYGFRGMRNMAATGDSTVESGVLESLTRVLSGSVCILGVGNRHRRDDGIGSLIAERLAGRLSGQAIDAGDVPENYLEKVARCRPDTVLVVDAVDFGGDPGEWRVLDPGALALGGLSSHALSLRMAADYLSASTQARVALLAIQPADVGAGMELSDEVSQTMALLEEALAHALEGNPPCTS